MYDIATRTTHRHRARRSTRRSHYQKSKCELNNAYYDPPEVNVVCTKFQRVELEVEVEESAIESVRHDTNTRTDSVKTYTDTRTGGKRTSQSATTHTHRHNIDALVCSLPVNLSHHIANVSVQAVCVCVCVACTCLLAMLDMRN